MAIKKRSANFWEKNMYLVLVNVKKHSGCLHWDDLIRISVSEINQNITHQKNWGIHLETHWFIWRTMMQVILDNWSWSRSSQRHVSSLLQFMTVTGSLLYLWRRWIGNKKVMHFSCFSSPIFMCILFNRLLISLTVTVVYQWVVSYSL